MHKNPLDKLAALPESHQELFLTVAASLAAVEPWVACPADVALGVRVPALGLDDGRVVVIGHGDEAYGYLLFGDAFSHRRFADVVEVTDGAADRMPRYSMLSFDAHTPEGGEAMIIPSVSVIENGRERAPDRHELDQLIAVTAGLTRFIEQRAGSRELAWVWGGGPAVEGAHTVDVDGTAREVIVRAPAVGVQL